MAEETLKGKQAFETSAKQHGVSIQSYGANKGIFKANDWLLNCRNNRQGLSFAGINAHHINGVAERKVRELQSMARTMMLHATRRWQAAMSTHLCPYALRQALMAINASLSSADIMKQSPMEVFSNTKVTMNLKHWKTFGCPVYILKNELQTNF